MKDRFSVFAANDRNIESKRIWYSESRLMLSLVNVNSRLMLSHFEISFTIASYIKITGCCYHSVNVITFGLAQSDHIKRLLLYNHLQTMKARF
jgi:hypothetical protein